MIDDGSTDDSFDICQVFATKDTRVKAMRQSNAGPSKARNVGIRQAEGEYITFVDSDDFVSDSYLLNLLSSKADIVASGYDIWYEKGDIHNYRSVDSICEFSVEKENVYDGITIGEMNNIWKGPCAKLYRRNILIDYNIYFDEKFKYGEDHLFNLNYLKKAKSIVLLPVCDYVYAHYGKASLTNRTVPYIEMFEYITAANHLRYDIMNHSKMGYVDFCHKEACMYFWQTVYSMYIQEKNYWRRKRTFIKYLDEITSGVVFMHQQMPIVYKIEQYMFAKFPFVLVDIFMVLFSKRKR